MDNSTTSQWALDHQRFGLSTCYGADGLSCSPIRTDAELWMRSRALRERAAAKAARGGDRYLAMHLPKYIAREREAEADFYGVEVSKLP